MDAAAISLCKDNAMPLLVFNMTEPGNIARVLKGETSARWCTNHRTDAAGCQTVFDRASRRAVACIWKRLEVRNATLVSKGRGTR